MLRRRHLLTAAAVLAAPARAATEIRFGSVGGLTDAGIWLAEEAGHFAAAGLSVRALRMPNAPALLTALATGALDIAGISITPGLFSSITQGVQIRIVGDKQSVRPGFSATRLVVRAGMQNGTEAEQVVALKGKPIALSAKAASVALVLKRYLAGFGLSFADVRLVELPYPSMISALGSGAVDAAVILEPFLSQSIQTGIARQLNDLAHASGTSAARSSTAVPLVYSEAFASNRDTAQAFMDAYLRGVRIYNDAFAKNIDKDKVIGILTARAKVDAAVVRDGFPAGLDPNGRVDMVFLDECQRYFIEQQYLQAPIDLTKLVDVSFADNAVSRLGEYRVG